MSEASANQLKGFLKNIPWNQLSRTHKDRSLITMEAVPESTMDPAYVVFGMYVHGGVVGVTRISKTYPWLTRALCSTVRSCDPAAQVTSIGISCNCKAKAHRDKYNLSSRDSRCGQGVKRGDVLRS